MLGMKESRGQARRVVGVVMGGAGELSPLSHDKLTPGFDRGPSSLSGHSSPVTPPQRPLLPRRTSSPPCPRPLSGHSPPCPRPLSGHSCPHPHPSAVTLAPSHVVSPLSPPRPPPARRPVSPSHSHLVVDSVYAPTRPLQRCRSTIDQTPPRVTAGQKAFALVGWTSHS